MQKCSARASRFRPKQDMMMDRIAEIEQKLADAEALVHEKKLAEERLKAKKAK
jgi:hypothetical protein